MRLGVEKGGKQYIKEFFISFFLYVWKGAQARRDYYIPTSFLSHMYCTSGPNCLQYVSSLGYTYTRVRPHLFSFFLTTCYVPTYISCIYTQTDIQIRTPLLFFIMAATPIKSIFTPWHLHLWKYVRTKRKPTKGARLAAQIQGHCLEESSSCLIHVKTSLPASLYFPFSSFVQSSVFHTLVT